jgi:hypothetical protein
MLGEFSKFQLNLKNPFQNYFRDHPIFCDFLSFCTDFCTAFYHLLYLFSLFFSTNIVLLFRHYPQFCVSSLRFIIYLSPIPNGLISFLFYFDNRPVHRLFKASSLRKDFNKFAQNTFLLTVIIWKDCVVCWYKPSGLHKNNFCRFDISQ